MGQEDLLVKGACTGQVAVQVESWAVMSLGRVRQEGFLLEQA